MKKFLLPAVLVLAAMATSVSAATISVGNPYSHSTRNTDFDQNIESESGAVTKVGSWTNFNVDAGATPWGSGTWLFSTGSYVEVAFSVAADTLFAQFQSDSNDGIADFWVDGAFVGSLNTRNRGWFQAEISDLTLGAHTLRIVSGLNPGGPDDLAFDNFMAKDNSVSVIPLPAGAPLLLGGLGLLIGLRRKSRK